MITNNTNELATATTHVEEFVKTHDTIHVAEDAVFKALTWRKNLKVVRR